MESTNNYLLEFPNNDKNVFRQEMKVYERINGGIKITTHTRDFISTRHFDCIKTEVMIGGSDE